MPELKEPNFFSDDDQYQRGMDWYEKLFEAAREEDIIGEASTHYTKLPTYPDTFSRLSSELPDVKLIYIMRDPIDRLISQYIHEWSCNNIQCDINSAIEKHPELIRYSCYADQLNLYLKYYGSANILPVFFERIKLEPNEELGRIAKFVGYEGKVCWDNSLNRTNVSSERLRTNVLSRFIIENPLLAVLRRTCVPAPFRNAIKSRMRMSDRPELTEDSRKTLGQIFDIELGKLGLLLGIDLNSKNYKETVIKQPLEWSLTKDQGSVARVYECN